MATRIGGLGRGLGALIPSDPVVSEAKGAGEKKVSVGMIEPNRDQPRKTFNEDSLYELSENIRQFGVISPILVKERDGYYEIIAGERRWRAARMAGLAEVPVIVRDVSEEELIELSLIENIQREDLNPIEEARAYKRLIEEFHLKQDEIAGRVSKSRAAVANSVRLLNLDERVQEMLAGDVISMGHARAILGIADKDEQYGFARYVADENLSVREVEREVRRLQEDPDALNREKTKGKQELDSSYAAAISEQEERLKVILGTKVAIRAKDRQKGKIEIEYYSQESLNALLETFGRI